MAIPIAAPPMRLPILEPLLNPIDSAPGSSAPTVYPSVRTQKEKPGQTPAESAVPKQPAGPKAQSAATEFADEFSGLVRDIAGHPLFNTLQSGTDTSSNETTIFDSIKMVESMSAKDGLRMAMSKHGALTVFMCAMARAWRDSSVPATGNGGYKLSEHARKVLQEYFDSHFKNPYPSDAEKAKLAEEAGITYRQVVNYMGNRRMRLKRTRLQKLQNTNISSLNPKVKWRNIMFGPTDDNSSPSSLQGLIHGNGREHLTSANSTPNEERKAKHTRTDAAPSLFEPLVNLGDAYSNDHTNGCNERSGRFS